MKFKDKAYILQFITMTHEQLTEILSQHKLWLENEGGQRANLSGANLHGANLSGANLRGAILTGANLSGANLHGANLSGANLRGANLSGAYLSRAYLYEADLRGANLTGANLHGADLHGADLSGALGIMQFGPMPTSGRIIFFVQHESAIMAQAGCFWGTIDELEQAVKAKHNCPMYLGIIALVRQQWKPINNQ